MTGVRPALVAVAAAAALLAVVSTAAARIPAQYRSCTAFNRVYPHGVGQTTARDHVSSGTPVTTFRRSTRLYNLALK